MKVILYMTITVNGFIAKSDGDSEWVSEANTNDFYAICRRIGVVIMGRHTFDLLNPDYLPLKNGQHIVLTHEQLSTDNPTVIFKNQSPREILLMLDKRGVSEVCVIGGQELATEFMNQGLIDELYLNVEPHFFGKGISIVSESNFSHQLDLIEHKQLGENTVQLHYLVNK